MSSGQIHYEIYIKAPKGKWQFCGAIESRDKALKQAKELAGGGASVQVMKETLGADGNYLSVRIFQEGDCGSTRPNAGKQILLSHSRVLSHLIFIPMRRAKQLSACCRIA